MPPPRRQRIILQNVHKEQPDWRNSKDVFGFYNKSNRVISDTEFYKLFYDPTYQRMARDERETEPPRKKIVVSTVWLGIDHGIGPEAHEPGEAVIFETMVFEDGAEVDCQRYKSEDAAIRGHETMKLKWGWDPPAPPGRFGKIDVE